MEDYQMKAMDSLTEKQRGHFLNHFERNKKSEGPAYIFVFFLGGLGGHHYYMGNIGAGVFYTLFCWTFIPLVLSVFELFFISSYVYNYNEALAYKTAKEMKFIFPDDQKVEQIKELAS